MSGKQPIDETTSHDGDLASKENGNVSQSGVGLSPEEDRRLLRRIDMWYV
jgi:hypothetical protein